MQIKNYNSGYLVVTKRSWEKFKIEAYATKYCENLEQAENTKKRLERLDRIEFVIVDGIKKIKKI